MNFVKVLTLCCGRGSSPLACGRQPAPVQHSTGWSSLSNPLLTKKNKKYPLLTDPALPKGSKTAPPDLVADGQRRVRNPSGLALRPAGPEAIQPPGRPSSRGTKDFFLGKVDSYSAGSHVTPIRRKMLKPPGRTKLFRQPTWSRKTWVSKDLLPALQTMSRVLSFGSSR